MNFSEAFEGPIVEKIGGVDVTFPLLLIDDYTGWINSLTSNRRARARQLIPSTASTGDRFQLAQQCDTIEIGLETISTLIWTIPGSRKVLELSLTRAGIPAAEHAEIIGRVKPRRLHSLAAEVSGLFEQRIPNAPIPPKAPDAEAEGDPDPNSSSPAE